MRAAILERAPVNPYSGVRKRVAGTTLADLRAAFDAAGFAVYRLSSNSEGVGMTLARWLAERPDRGETNLVVVSAGRRDNGGGHWIAVAGNKLCDSFTGEPVWLRQAPWRRCRVKAVYRIVREADVARPQPRQRRKRRRKAARPRPYRACALIDAGGGYRAEPLGPWASKEEVEYQQIPRADEVVGECGSGTVDALDGGEGSPVVIQRRRDGAYVREQYFYDWMRFPDLQLDELPWLDDPVRAVQYV